VEACIEHRSQVLCLNFLPQDQTREEAKALTAAVTAMQVKLRRWLCEAAVHALCRQF
jgi:hypothetical protein